MRDETKKYLRSQETAVQIPESEISINNKILEIINIINNQLAIPTDRAIIIEQCGGLNTKNQLIDNYLDFIRLTLKYIIFDNEALKREIVELQNMLEGDDGGCDLDNQEIK